MIESSCSYVGRAHRKRAGVGKAIQQSLGRNLTDITAIFSLIGKQAHREARIEVDPKFQTSLGSDRL